jgi:hypothetical protein
VRGLPPGRGQAAGAEGALAGLDERLARIERRLAEPPPDPAKALEPVRKRLDELAGQAREQRQRLDELLRRLDGRRRRLWSLLPLRRLLARLQGPAATSEPPPAPPPVSILTGAKRHGDGRTVLALVLGLPPEAQAELVARLAAAPPFPGLVPVWVTDGLAFEPFRRHGTFFEHLPGAKDRDGRDWELYRIRRFAILCRKWQPVRVVAFGATARQWLARTADSPHAPPDLAALIGPEPAPVALAPARSPG